MERQADRRSSLVSCKACASSVFTLMYMSMTLSNDTAENSAGCSQVALASPLSFQIPQATTELLPTQLQRVSYVSSFLRTHFSQENVNLSINLRYPEVYNSFEQLFFTQFSTSLIRTRFFNSIKKSENGVFLKEVSDIWFVCASPHLSVRGVIFLFLAFVEETVKGQTAKWTIV